MNRRMLLRLLPFIAWCQFLSVSPALGQTQPPDDDLERLRNIAPAVAQEPALPQGHMSSFSLRIGDTLDIQSERKSFRVAPPNLDLPSVINRVYADVRWQQGIGSDISDSRQRPT